MSDDMWPLTGLPHLPNGYFWRIDEGIWHEYSDTKHPYISIRRRTWVSSRFVTYSWFYDGDTNVVKVVDDLTLDIIRATAVKLRAEFQKIQDRKMRTKELLGDYPPKKLEV